MSIYATKNARAILREFSNLPQMQIGETIRVQLKPRALVVFESHRRAAPYASTPPSRVTSGRERSTE